MQCIQIFSTQPTQTLPLKKIYVGSVLKHVLWPSLIQSFQTLEKKVYIQVVTGERDRLVILWKFCSSSSNDLCEHFVNCLIMMCVSILLISNTLFESVHTLPLQKITLHQSYSHEILKLQSCSHSTGSLINCKIIKGDLYEHETCFCIETNYTVNI